MKKITISFLFSLFILSLQAQAPAGKALFGSLRARQIGPAAMSGRITSLDAERNNPEVIYVGAAGGGVWKTNSGGGGFSPIFEEYCQAIGKITIDQQNPKTVWVGTGEPWVRNSVSPGDGIYKTTDGGTNWTNMGLKNSERIADIIVHPTNSEVVYVAALGSLWKGNDERGVFKTTDGGKTWTKIFYIDENTGAADLDIDPKNPDVLYAAMWGFRRQPWTFDSGFGGKSGLYKSTDGGKTWNTIHNGLPNETLGRIGIAVAPSNGNVIYASVECKSKDKKGLYLSTDAGANWKKVSNEQNTAIRPFYFSHLVVDPKNDSIVMKCGLSMIISEDRGDRFRSMDFSVHSDIHAIWIDPNNTKHVLLGSDGGVYESFDRGRTFKMFMNLPVSQFYHVSVDDAVPFNVYGGLQDNGSWYAPSRKAGGITNADWQPTFGGDGFWSFRHPTDADVVFAEYQGGNLVRYSKKTGVAKEIRPFPAADEAKYRFNWNAPIQISSNNPNRLYFGSQYLFMSEDKGESWKRISGDLTTNDLNKQKQKESGGLSIDNSTAENHCTIYHIAESYQDGNTIWVGTDDGNVQVSTNAGQSWSNVVTNITGLPKNIWVSFIEPGHFDKNTAYVTFDGHRTGDNKAYIFKTTDLGKTWTSIATPQIESYVFSIREDLVNPNLLFLGTEVGLYISTDGGVNWARFDNNLPKVAVHDLVIHPRDHALVMGTHGRGVIILDDITPLRQLNKEMLGKTVQFLENRPTLLRDPGASSNWFGGSGNFVGPNPNSAAKIVYYTAKRHTFGKMYVEVWKDGKLLKTLPAGKSAGINIVEMPTAMNKPKAAPTNNRQALFGSLFGPNFPAGKYDVKLIKGNETYESSFTLMNDPNAPYTDADRSVQREWTMRLYNLTEKLAYLYATYGEVETKAKALKAPKGKLQTTLNNLVKKAQTAKDTLVALGGDGYVDEGEQIAERVADIYRQVSSFPGRPTDSQIKRATLLEQEIGKIEAGFKNLLEKDLAAANQALTAAKLTPITYRTMEQFLKEGEDGASAGSGGMYYQQLVSHPLGLQILSFFGKMK
jgi:photosystem II stability/assembly factor-like uncharacterized protein